MNPHLEHNLADDEFACRLLEDCNTCARRNVADWAAACLANGVDPRDTSVYSGTAGIAYAVERAAAVSAADGDTGKARAFHQAAIRTLGKAPGADIANSVHQCSLLRGPAGWHLAAVLIGAPCAAASAVAYEQLAPKRQYQLDGVEFGRAGWILGALMVNAKKDRSDLPTVARDTIAKVVLALVGTGRAFAKISGTGHLEQLPLLWLHNNREFSGTAHGLFGILYALLSVELQMGAGTLDSIVPGALADVKGAVDWCDHAAIQVQTGRNWPTLKGERSPCLTQWSDGAPGAIYLFAAAIRVFGDGNGRCVPCAAAASASDSPPPPPSLLAPADTETPSSGRRTRCGGTGP